MNALPDKPTTPPSPLPPSGPGVNVELVNPLSVSGWDELVRSHRGGQFFHSQAWIRVLHEAYGFEPMAFCVRAGHQLRALLVLLEARSGLWGRRGVSLPFSDECPPLETPDAPVACLLEPALAEGRKRGWTSVEWRGGGVPCEGTAPSLSFLTHELDLRSGPEKVWARFDDTVRRAIRKAERAAVVVDLRRDEGGLKEYYTLHCETRQRHGLPPQPWSFFRTIQGRVLAQEKGAVFLARVEGQVIAGAVFFHFGTRAFYKFGASGVAHQGLRPNNAVMWAAIQHYAQAGMENLHWGRTSLEHDGLRRYKLGWGTREERLNYFKFDLRRAAYVVERDRTDGWHTALFRRMPIPLLRRCGELLYPYQA